jgi:hypothetical protein
VAVSALSDADRLNAVLNITQAMSASFLGD